MNNELTLLEENAPLITGQLQKTVEQLASYLKAETDFAIEQTPLLIQEILRWNIYTSAIYLGIATLILAVGVASGIKFYRNIGEWSDRCSNDGKIFVCGTIAGVCSVGGFIAFFVNLSGVLKPILAPRLFLLDYFAHLVK